MPGPSSRTETVISSRPASARTQAVAPVPDVGQHVVEAGAHRGDRLGRRRARRPARRRPASRPPPAPGAPSPSPRARRRGRPGRPQPAGDGVLLADERAQRCAPARPPAGRAPPTRPPAAAPRRCVIASTWSTPSCTARASRVRSSAAAAARSAASRSRAIRCSDSHMKPTIGPADEDQEDVAVVALVDLGARQQVGGGDQRRRRRGRRASASGSPTRAGRPSPRSPGSWR